MDTALIITVCLSGTVGRGVPAAGFCALLAHDDADLATPSGKGDGGEARQSLGGLPDSTPRGITHLSYCLHCGHVGRAALDLGWTDLRLVAVIAAQFT